MKLPALKRPFAFLAMLLLAWAQCFGVGSGFVCFCTGKPVQTTVDHCHGPHGIDCQACHNPHYHHHDDNDGQHDGSNTEQHDSFKEDLKLPTSGKIPTAPAFSPVFMAVLPDLEVIGPATRALHGFNISRPPPDFARPSAYLAHTVALLI